jgi:hypothetical protein
MHPVFSKISTDTYLSAVRRVSFGACCLYLAVAGSGALGYGVQEADQEREKVPPARQNSILRDHFRKQFSKMGAFQNSPGRRSNPFAENFIDRQIDNFLSELQDKLSLLRSQLAQVEASRASILETFSPEEQRLARRGWEQSLKGIERSSGDVWTMLRYLLTGLEDRDKFKPHFSAQDRGAGFQRQVEFMAEETAQAERKIRHYFFESGSIVHAEDLTGENMLIHLFHVRQMAKELKDEKF